MEVEKYVSRSSRYERSGKGRNGKFNEGLMHRLGAI